MITSQRITDFVAFAVHELSHLIIDAEHGAQTGTITREAGGAWRAESDLWDHYHVDLDADVTQLVLGTVASALVAGPTGELLARLAAEGLHGELAHDAVLERVRLGTLWSSYAARSDRDALLAIAPHGRLDGDYLARLTQRVLPTIEQMMVQVGHRRLLSLGCKMRGWQAGQGVSVDLAALQRGTLITDQLHANETETAEPWPAA